VEGREENDHQYDYGSLNDGSQAEDYPSLSKENGFNPIQRLQRRL